MLIKTYQIRINNEFRQTDEWILNQFLKEVTLISVDKKICESTNTWNILISYDPKSTKSTHRDTGEPLTNEQRYRYDCLRQWRADKAASMSVDNYMIAFDRDLMNVARADIQKPEDLMSVKGFKEKRTEQYGKDIVALLNSI